MGQASSKAPGPQQSQIARFPAFQAASEKPIPFRYHDYDMTVGHCDTDQYFAPQKGGLDHLRRDINQDTIPLTKPAQCVAYLKHREDDAAMWLCQGRKGEPKKPSEDDLVLAAGNMITNCAYGDDTDMSERPWYGGTWPVGNKEDGIFILVDKLTANYT